MNKATKIRPWLKWTKIFIFNILLNRTYEKSLPSKEENHSVQVVKNKWYQMKGLVLECAANRYKHTSTQWMRMNIAGHTFPPFSLSFSFAPSFHNLSLSSFFPPLLLPQSLSLFLSVKVMQLIFLCLFIFQDWLWNVGSRQKPHRPLPFAPSLSSPPPTASLPSLPALTRPKTLGQEGVWRNATSPTPPHSPSSPLSTFNSSTCVPFPSSPFQLDLWPHSTNGIKVMHHT